MTRLPRPFLIIAAVPALCGCVAGMAMSALGMAANSARGRPVGNEALQPQAREQCSAEAAKYGSVHVIDVVQDRVDRIIVWGTVDDGKEKRSFECDYGIKITGFTLRPIKPLQ